MRVEWSCGNISEMVDGDLAEVFDMGCKGELRFKSDTKVGEYQWVFFEDYGVFWHDLCKCVTYLFCYGNINLCFM